MNAYTGDGQMVTRKWKVGRPTGIDLSDHLHIRGTLYKCTKFTFMNILPKQMVFSYFFNNTLTSKLFRDDIVE